jgi:hypothetical protein
VAKILNCERDDMLFKKIILNEIYKLKKKQLYYILLGIALVCLAVTFGYTKNPINVTTRIIQLNILDLMVSILLPTVATIIIGSLISDERISGEMNIFLLNGKVTIESLIYAKLITIIIILMAMLICSFIIVDISMSIIFQTAFNILYTFKLILLELFPLLGIYVFIMVMSFYVKSWLIILIYFCVYISIRVLNVILPLTTFLTPFSIVSLMLADIDNRTIMIEIAVSLIWVIMFGISMYKIPKYKDILS